MRFKVLESSHTTKDGVTYSKGDVFESDLDLCSIFRNKFQLIEPEQEVPEQPGEVVASTDVTDLFDGAADLGVVISRSGSNRFDVSKNGTLVNDSPLSKAKVKVLLEEMATDPAPAE